jgi:nitroreductase
MISNTSGAQDSAQDSVQDSVQHSVQPSVQPSLDIVTALRTNAAVREFTDRRVDDETVLRILDTARFAPSGGNKQGWHVIVVKDPAIRAELCRLSRLTWNEYIALTQAGQRPFAADASGHWPGPGSVDLTAARNADVPWKFSADFAKEPVIMVVAVDITVLAAMDTELDRVGLAAGGSIYPFAQNILLAARAEGLGGTLTTFLARQEPAAQTVLGLPKHFAIAGLISLGEPVVQLTKLSRRPVHEFATIDRFDGSAIGGERGNSPGE